jgi:hypothetical protein
VPWADLERQSTSGCFAPESERVADIGLLPLRADFVAKLFDDFGEQ